MNQLDRIEENRRIRLMAASMGAHLEALEAHCSGASGRKGEDHAAEGRELRAAGQKLIYLANELLCGKGADSQSSVRQDL